MTSTHTPRVAIVAASLRILGGQGVQAALLVNALRSDGYAVTFVPIDSRLPRALRWVRDIRFLRTIANQLLYLPSLVRLGRVDVVHVFSASYWSFLLAPLPAMLVARACGKRVVLHYHSGEASDHLEHWGILVHPWLKFAHEIVVPSDYLRGVFAAHGYRARVIPNFVELRLFHYRERRPIGARFLSIRNLEPYYRVDVIVDAFATIKARVPGATLTIAGYGSERLRLQAQADRLGVSGSVRFLGKVEPADVPRVFDEADLFLNASVLDNQPISVLEAFAAGTPVITTGAGDIPAMVADGERGRLVPANDPIAMARAALSLLDDPETAVRLAQRANRSLARYTWSSVREGWQDVYVPAAPPNRPPSMAAA